MPELPLSVMPHHRSTQAFTHYYRRPSAVVIGHEVHNDTAGPDPAAVPDRGAHPGPGMQPVFAGQHVTP